MRLLYWTLNLGIYGTAGLVFGPLVVVPLFAMDILSWLDATGRLGKKWKCVP